MHKPSSLEDHPAGASATAEPFAAAAVLSSDSPRLVTRGETLGESGQPERQRLSIGWRSAFARRRAKRCHGSSMP
jgi:hypothetical protein